MANFTIADIKALREQLGTGMVDTKKALEEADGDVEKAVEILRLKGAKGNAKRADRSTSEGLIAARELDGKVTLIELACETDFVAKNDRFVALADKVVEAAAAAGANSVDEALAASAGAGTVDQLISDEAAIIGEKVELRQVRTLEGEKFEIYLHKTNKDLPRPLARWRSTSPSPTRRTCPATMSPRPTSRRSARSSPRSLATRASPRLPFRRSSRAA